MRCAAADHDAATAGVCPVCPVCWCRAFVAAGGVVVAVGSGHGTVRVLVVVVTLRMDSFVRLAELVRALWRKEADPDFEMPWKELEASPLQGAPSTVSFLSLVPPVGTCPARTSLAGRAHRHCRNRYPPELCPRQVRLSRRRGVEGMDVRRACTSTRTYRVVLRTVRVCGNHREGATVVRSAQALD